MKKEKNHMVPTSVHGAAFGEKQNHFFLLIIVIFVNIFLIVPTIRNFMKHSADSP